MTQQEVERPRALVCTVCGILAPDTNDFIVGFMAGQHEAHYHGGKHKLSIQTVDEKDVIANRWQLSMLLALIVRKKLRL